MSIVLFLRCISYLFGMKKWMRYEIDWLTPSQFLGTNSPPTTKVRFQDPVSNQGVRRLEMATDARSRGVQGHVVRSSIVVSPGGKVWKMCPRYETSPQRYENKNLKVWNFFYKVWNFCIGVWKKFLRYENKNLKVRVWNWFLRVWKIFWQGMKLLYKGMKKVFKVWNFCIRVWKKFSFFWGYEIIFEGMKKSLLGMKKIRFLQKNIFTP